VALRLFSYGSLQQPAVQLSTFGRLLEGREDSLPGFVMVVQHGERRLANVIRTGLAQRAVPGMVFEISNAELAAADEYERADAYTRIPAVLSSGIEAWVYVDATSLRASG